jgi:hypothetical protein
VKNAPQSRKREQPLRENDFISELLEELGTYFSNLTGVLDDSIKVRIQNLSENAAKFIARYSPLMYHLHWRTLRNNARNNAGDIDTYCTCLGHFGQSDIKRNNPICVAVPKKAKASKQGLSLSPALSR